MFTIGEFARLASVTVRAVRHYDQIGLVQPNRIDELTGYRYYAASQLPRINRIVALQRLGFSLREIEEMLTSTTVEAIRGMLVLRKSQVEDELADQQAALTEIEGRLRALEREDSMSDLDVTVKSIPHQRVAAIGARVPGFGPANTTDVLLDCAATLEEALAAADVEPTGFWFICFERVDEEIFAYFCLPISDSVASLPEPAHIYELDEVPKAISLVRAVENLDGYSDAYQDVAMWAETNGYIPVGDGRDASLDGNGKGSGSVMETLWPVRRVDEPVPNVSLQRVG